jgi:flagellin
MDGLSMVQTAEGGMNEASNLLIRLRELSIQSASDTVSNKERKLIQLEVNQIKAEMNRLAEATRYSETPLLNGQGGEFEFQIGPDNNENNRVVYDSSKINIKPDELGVDDIELEEKDDARDAIESLDKALEKLQTPRAEVAAIQTRLHTISRQLTTENESLMAAHGRIVDADIAHESSELIRAQTIQAAGIAVLTQANQLPAVALQLIK